MRRPSKKMFVLGSLALLAMATWTCSACSTAYIARAAVAEARILSRREPIADVVANESTPAPVRRKLELVVTAREFAAKELELDVGDSYTTYSPVKSDTLALVLSGAEKTSFSLVTWWFPIVGRVPYKGFFEEDQALEAQRELEEKGYDTYLRPTGAFSTLGWFNDPVLTTVLRYGDVGLASTVIHELTHNTMYLPGQAAFNESFANFVGDRGAIELFCRMDGENGQRCRDARAVWADNLVFADYLAGLISELETLYARDDLSRDAKLAERERVFAEQRAKYANDVEPRLRTRYFTGFGRTPLNNATLIARRLYYDRLRLFEAAWEANGEDVRGTVKAVVTAAEASPDDPWSALEALGRR